jgi:hypothetical protein
MSPAIALAPFVQPGVTFEPVSHTYSYFDAPVLNVTRILREHKISACWGDVPPDVLERKREIGRAAHIATHYFDEGDLQPGTVAPEVCGYLDAWRRFKEENDFQPLLLETCLVHPTNRYAGTVDRWGLVRNLSELPAIVDLKTGDPDDAGAGPQTAAYEELVRASLGAILAHLERQGFVSPWNFNELQENAWPRFSVQLKPDGRYALKPYKAFTDLRRFTCALTLEATAHPSWRQQR